MAGALTAEQAHESESPQVGRILFVGPHDQHSLAEALEARGFQIVRTDSIDDALTLVVASRVTLVVTGGRGDDETGLTFLKALRDLPEGVRRKDVPVIWLGIPDDHEDTLLRQGVSLFLRPPYPVEHLVTAAMFAA